MTTILSSNKAAMEWRTAFLTLRDEAHHNDCSFGFSEPIEDLLGRVIFSQLTTLTAVSHCLPTHEVTSDILFLMELVSKWRCWKHADFVIACHKILRMIYEICQGQQVPLQLNSSTWQLFLEYFAQMLQLSLSSQTQEPVPDETFKSVKLCLDILRLLMCSHQQQFMLHDDIQLENFLLNLIEYFNLQLLVSFNTINCPDKHVDYWQCQTCTYLMLNEVIQRSGSSFPGELWLRTIEVLRKLLELLPSMGSICEDKIMSRFLVAVLTSLHTVLLDPKSSVKDHVSSFVASLRLLFLYGLSGRTGHKNDTSSCKEKELALRFPEKVGSTSSVPYRPPHLRRQEKSGPPSDSSTSFCHDSLASSSDSDCSDCDGGSKDFYSSQFAKVRVCSIVCIQDLCQIDPKSFTNQWMSLLPTSDVLQPRKLEATLMTCLLFDPHVKVQMAASSALAVMLDKKSSSYLQVAEYTESTKLSAFVPLSSSLGCMLMQMHTGFLYIIQRERHSRLLTSLLQILSLLILRTPYSRMPKELLPMVINFIIEKINSEHRVINDLNDHLISLIGCMGAALSLPSQQVNNMLVEELSTDKPHILATLFEYSSQGSKLPACVEALQALRSVFHLYPHLGSHCWERVTCLVANIISISNFTSTAKGKEQGSYGFIEEKALGGSIKVLDECLRAISGFRGTEDLDDDKVSEAPFVPESTRSKKVSSAPSFVCENLDNTENETQLRDFGSKCWCQTVENILPQLLQHKFAMVRTASVTCFAGITSLAFNSISKELQNFVIDSLLNAAVYDAVPSVRSSAFRAIGVISCFLRNPWSAGIVGRFFNAIEKNLNDPVVTVRITASWALANLCESIPHYMEFKEYQYTSLDDEIMFRFTHVALRLTNEGDKIKSNAVRGLGNLGRYLNSNLSSEKENLAHSEYSKRSSDIQHKQSLLDLVVQALLSSVTSGNVKVQWNVCHALGNLFRNRSIVLHDMDWAPSVYSILLLLLRDSSNFKIRIQAAAALDIPSSIRDYGRSYLNIVQVLLHTLENFGSIQISDPSSFKYRAALEQQITNTTLHILSMVSSSEHNYSLKDFLVKKTVFLEKWFGSVSGIAEKGIADKALRSLSHFFSKRCGHSFAPTFQKLTMDPNS